MKPLLVVFLLAVAAHGALTEKELESIGLRVWKNECAGTREGLTSWNKGEDFASLGIGHFIWYPEGGSGPFEESFPKLLAFFAANGVRLPSWISPSAHCPWRTRAEFQAEAQSPRAMELRELLTTTIPLQCRFLAKRQEEALPKMLEVAAPGERENVRRQYARMSATGQGTFALIDYVNFKGEGVKDSERYHGEGWGLLQVLSAMRGEGGGAPREFSAAASAVLTQRVHNAPAERHEERWLGGWKSRVQAYAE